MKDKIVSLTFVICLCALNSAMATQYTTEWFATAIDHFNFNLGKYQMRYLINTQYWDADSGPILFYAGNEGDIGNFWDNSGFITDTLAQELNGMVLFAEHRYFGQSMPFGNESYSKENIGYLSVQQAMSDYVDFIYFIREKYNAQNIPVIVFGGSYGGMLASWLRMKFPYVFQGALASSAPILYFKGVTDPYAFSKLTTQAFTNASANCSFIIRDAFQTLYEHENRNSSYTQISKIFNTCKPVTSIADVQALIDLLYNGYNYLAMTNYPYPSDFLMPMPGFPIQYGCDIIKNSPQYVSNTFDKLKDEFDKELGRLTRKEIYHLKLANAVVQVYFNYTGETPCTDLGDTGGGGSSLGVDGWYYLACTEMVMPMGNNGVTDMFLPQPWDELGYNEWCQYTFGVTPNYNEALNWFGGHNAALDFQSYSNIIFSNGQLDPWRAGGVNFDINESVTALYIELSAHHLDLRLPNPQDPESIVRARQIETSTIAKWIADYNKEVDIKMPQV